MAFRGGGVGASPGQSSLSSTSTAQVYTSAPQRSHPHAGMNALSYLIENSGIQPSLPQNQLVEIKEFEGEIAASIQKSIPKQVNQITKNCVSRAFKAIEGTDSQPFSLLATHIELMQEKFDRLEPNRPIALQEFKEYLRVANFSHLKSGNEEELALATINYGIIEIIDHYGKYDNFNPRISELIGALRDSAANELLADAPEADSNGNSATESLVTLEQKGETNTLIVDHISYTPQQVGKLQAYMELYDKFTSTQNLDEHLLNTVINATPCINIDLAHRVDEFAKKRFLSLANGSRHSANSSNPGTQGEEPGAQQPQPSASRSNSPNPPLAPPPTRTSEAPTCLWPFTSWPRFDLPQINIGLPRNQDNERDPLLGTVTQDNQRPRSRSILRPRGGNGAEHLSARRNADNGRIDQGDEATLNPLTIIATDAGSANDGGSVQHSLGGDIDPADGTNLELV